MALIGKKIMDSQEFTLKLISEDNHTVQDNLCKSFYKTLLIPQTIQNECYFRNDAKAPYDDRKTPCISERTVNCRCHFPPVHVYICTHVCGNLSYMRLTM